MSGEKKNTFFLTMENAFNLLLSVFTGKHVSAFRALLLFVISVPVVLVFSVVAAAVISSLIAGLGVVFGGLMIGIPIIWAFVIPKAHNKRLKAHNGKIPKVALHGADIEITVLLKMWFDQSSIYSSNKEGLASANSAYCFFMAATLNGLGEEVHLFIDPKTGLLNYVQWNDQYHNYFATFPTKKMTGDAELKRIEPHEGGIHDFETVGTIVNEASKVSDSNYLRHLLSLVAASKGKKNA